MQCLEQPAAQRHVGRAGARPRADPLRADRRPPRPRTARSTCPASTRKVAQAQRQAARAHPGAALRRRRSSRRTAGMMPGVRLAGEREYSIYERMWTRPSLTVIAFEAHPFLGSSNQIIDAARARLSLRTVPSMDAQRGGPAAREEAHDQAALRRARSRRTVSGTTPWWTTDPEGRPSRRRGGALKAGFGKETAMIGAGGSIGFVQPFADLLGRRALPADGRRGPRRATPTPRTRACTSATGEVHAFAIHLYDALAGVPKR